ncbi:MAG: MBL fold metallo-hydrolase [Bacteroidales bacterium]|jgi:glyoxylase-like metal-dependent hydrolase (beta-lactamase superfamily II)|nr:MBL fold metallo-hydrolase [Bacteroidales bacterium]
MKILTLVFNHFLVNTYLIYADNNDCVLIDPACNNEMEEQKLQEVISNHKLSIKYILLTHTHIDHIAGCEFAKKMYHNAKLVMHKDALPLYENANNFTMVMGFNKQNLPEVDEFIAEDQYIELGEDKLKVIHTPGHANGSICLYAEKYGFVVSGDVLFLQSIGRSDLPGGNHQTLLNSIKNKLLSLPPDTKVFPGHGDATDIAFEKENNPFL